EAGAEMKAATTAVTAPAATRALCLTGRETRRMWGAPGGWLLKANGGVGPTGPPAPARGGRRTVCEPVFRGTAARCAARLRGTRGKRWSELRNRPISECVT